MTIPAKVATPAGDIMESVIIKGDVGKLTPEERVRYYNEVCRSIGLNPLTRPLEYITLSGKLTLYARRDAADQLRKINGISVEIVSQETTDGLLTVHVRARDPSGRTDEDVGVVNLPDTMRGEMRANQILKCVTKAKRRVTLSISGLGFLDETEVEDIPAAAKKPSKPAPNVLLHDPQTGEIHEPPAGDARPEVAKAGTTQHPAEDAAPSVPDTGGAAPLSIQEMARAAAMRGKPVFRTFWRNRSAAEQQEITDTMGDELRAIFEQQKEAVDGDTDPDREAHDEGRS